MRCFLGCLGVGQLLPVAAEAAPAAALAVLTTKQRTAAATGNGLQHVPTHAAAFLSQTEAKTPPSLSIDKNKGFIKRG